jgi:thiamine kinase-like enzyme
MPDTIVITKAIATIPALQGHTGRVQRLGGLTNRVYRLGDVCLRVPGDGTAAYIDRTAEAAMARLAADAGVSPALLHADPVTGLMATRFVDGAVTMTPDTFRNRTGAPARAAHALRRLHQSGAQFPVQFDLFAMIDTYLALLAPRDVALPDGYHAILAETGAIRAALAGAAAPRVPCHCDPLCENFLDTGARMWIVDWEYAGMNDPMWDLGDLSVEAGFDAALDTALLHAYFDGPANPRDHGRMVIYKAMCDLLWTLWGLIQLADGNPADDFRIYSVTRFARCKALMAQDDFPRHLAAITAA